MQSCPECKSARVNVTGVTMWTLRCDDCGFSTSGTASFPLVDEEVEHEYDLVFHLSSPKQIPIIRRIASELMSSSSAELLEAYHQSESRISVLAITMGTARDYIEAARAEGIPATIKNRDS